MAQVMYAAVRKCVFSFFRQEVGVMNVNWQKSSLSSLLHF